MSKQMGRGVKVIALSLVVSVVASCALLPRSGPNKSEIFSGSVMRQGDSFVVAVNDAVTRAAGVTPALGFSESFRNLGPLGADTIRPGDTLSLIVYENVEDGLLASGGAGAAAIDEVQVDSGGFIFVPYAGRLRAAGSTPEGLRRLITTRLDEQTPDPQVVVRRVAGNGASVSIVGGAAAQGVYPIERPTRTLTGMVAQAGGISIEPEVALVTVTRGNMTETAFLQDLYTSPHLDIALRDGDTIFIEQDTRNFTVLGATGTQTQVEFDKQVISAIEALAQVGGLNPNTANPTGVFVLRNEPQEVAAQVLNRTDLVGAQRIVYVLDLTEPNGLFHARDFVIRNGDTIFVTEAPIVAFNRAIAALLGSVTGIVQPAATVGSVSNAF